MSNTILTVDGQYFEYDNPVDYRFDINTIAHGLSNICRFTGQCKRFYSVAEHSVYVSLQVEPVLALEALLHDASEAFLGDVATPLKRMLPDYREIERRVEQAIAWQFGLAFPLHPNIKRADLELLMTEKRDLMPTPIRDTVEWPDVHPLNWSIPQYEVGPKLAASLFLDRYHELMARRER